MAAFFNHLELKLIGWLERRAWLLMRMSIGLIYLVFGVLKFFPQYSPAEDLAGETINLITFGLIDADLGLTLLAVIESGIGLCFLFCLRFRFILWVTLWHMACTFIPLIMLPQFAYTTAPFSFSIVGQYIFKNLIIISAVLLLYGHYGRKRNPLANQVQHS